jgi:hypothetical protein
MAVLVSHYNLNENQISLDGNRSVWAHYGMFTYRMFKKSLYNRYIVASLQHAEIGKVFIFLSRLVAQIYDICLLLTSAYKLEDIISSTFHK